MKNMWAPLRSISLLFMDGLGQTSSSVVVPPKPTQSQSESSNNEEEKKEGEEAPIIKLWKSSRIPIPKKYIEYQVAFYISICQSTLLINFSSNY